MENYICLYDERFQISDALAAQIVEALSQSKIKLSDVPVGETFKIWSHEMMVLEHSGDTTVVIHKNLLYKNETFGSTNNFAGSHVDALCSKFADEIAAIVGVENLVEHTVDLTSNDGLKDYGKIRRKASLLTADLYRSYVDVLDEHKLDKWWWLATPWSTKKHGSDVYVLCVSPSGFIDCDFHCFNDVGVRPFCILKSDIFVSK